MEGPQGYSRFSEVNEFLRRVGGYKSGIKEIEVGDTWVRRNHALLSCFNVINGYTLVDDKLLMDSSKELRKIRDDVADLCCYHSSSTPLTLAQRKNRKYRTRVSLEEKNKSLLSLCALLRILDACDETWYRVAEDFWEYERWVSDHKAHKVIGEIENTLLNHEKTVLVKKLFEALDAGNVEKTRETIKSFESEKGSLAKSLEDKVKEYWKEKKKTEEKIEKHTLSKADICDVFFHYKNHDVIEIILFPFGYRYGLTKAKREFLEKTVVERIRQGIQEVEGYLQKCDLAFTIRMANPEDDPKALEVPRIRPTAAQDEREILTLIEQGEGQNLEFKSTLRVDLKLPTTPPKEVEDRVVKEIYGFLNSPEGGKLLIGVGDDKKPLGLESDYESLSGGAKRGDRDVFQNHLHQVISSREDIHGRLYKIAFAKAKGKDVCVVNVEHAPKPMYRREGNQRKFYVREGNRTTDYQGNKALDYMLSVWPEIFARRADASLEKIPRPHLTSPIEETIHFREISSRDGLYEITTNDRFVEKPLKQGEWKSRRKKNVITFDEKMIQNASEKLSFHNIMLITGPPNVGKSTFLFFFLEEHLQKAVEKRHTVIFLDRFVGREEISSVLENIDSFVHSSHGPKNVLLVIDGLRSQREKDEHYVDKCTKLFKRASLHGYKLIATLRESHKEFLKCKLEPPEREMDEWSRFKTVERRIAYTPEQLESILMGHLNYYSRRIQLADVSFKDMNTVFLAQERPVEKKKRFQKFKRCMQSVVRKSEGLAGYIAFLIEDISQRDRVFSEKIIEKYPYGMVNLILNTIWRDYYVEGDELIPLQIVLLTKLGFSSDFALTKYFIKSFIAWGNETLNEKLREAEKKKILERAQAFTRFCTARTISIREREYKLLNYWRDAIGEVLSGETYDKRYTDVVHVLKEAEKTWKYWINSYIQHVESESEEIGIRPHMPYLVADIAKLWNITDDAVLEFSTAFYRKHQKTYGQTLQLQFDYLQKNLSLLLRLKAQTLVSTAKYDDAVHLLRKATRVDDGDYRAFWAIGELYEKRGQEKEGLNWYVDSAIRQHSSRGYGSLIGKIVNYCKRHRMPSKDRLRYIELQKDAASRALECRGNAHKSWMMLGEALRHEGNVLQYEKQYEKSITAFKKAIKSFGRANDTIERLRLPEKFLPHRQIALCHLRLENIYSKLQKPDTENHLKEARKHFEKAAETEDSTKGYLHLAYIMTRSEFYEDDSSACKQALKKIDTNELEGRDLVDYFLINGFDNENKTQFGEALSYFERAKELMLKYLDSSDSSSRYMHARFKSIYEDIGNCYQNIGNYEKAAESYLKHLDLKDYTPDGISGKIYGIFGHELFQMGIYDKAYYCFRRALKRDPENIRNLGQMVIVNDKLGQLEFAISNLKKILALYRSSEITEEWLLSKAESAEQKIEELRKKLEKKNQIASIQQEICSIAESFIASDQKKKEVRDLSLIWHKVRSLLDPLNPRDFEGDFGDVHAQLKDLKNSALLMSSKKLDEITARECARYHRDLADLLQEENRSPVLEIFHRLFSASIYSLIVDHLVREGKRKGDEKRMTLKRLSTEWGLMGRRVSKDLIAKIPHKVAIRFFELSVKIDPENNASWNNLGWEYFYDAIKRGHHYDFLGLDKAYDAFNKPLEIEEKSEKKYSYARSAKIGIGKVHEAYGNATSAAKEFKEASRLFKDLNTQEDAAKTVDNLIKTADSLRELRFLDLAKDEEIAFLKDALDMRKKALGISQKFALPNDQVNLIREKVLVCEEQVKDLETQMRDVEKTLRPEVLKPGRSIDETLSSHFESVDERISDVVSLIADDPENYNLFRQLFEERVRDIDARARAYARSQDSLIHLLDRIVSFSLKQATRESPFDVPAKLFQLCKSYCRDIASKGREQEFVGLEQEFFSLFDERMINRFGKIVLGIEYKMGPIASEEELISLLNEFTEHFGKLGARTPSLDEINEVTKRKRRQAHGLKFSSDSHYVRSNFD